MSRASKIGLYQPQAPRRVAYVNLNLGLLKMRGALNIASPRSGQPNISRQRELWDRDRNNIPSPRRGATYLLLAMARLAMAREIPERHEFIRADKVGKNRDKDDSAVFDYLII